MPQTTFTVTERLTSAALLPRLFFSFFETQVHRARVRLASVWISSRCGASGQSLDSADVFRQTFSPSKSTKYITQQAISDLSAARKRPRSCSVKMARADGPQLCARLWVRWWRGWRTDLFSSSCSPLSSDKPMDLKQGDKESILKPFPLVTAKPKQERRQQTATSAPAVNSMTNTTFNESKEKLPLHLHPKLSTSTGVSRYMMAWVNTCTVIIIRIYVPCNFAGAMGEEERKESAFNFKRVQATAGAWWAGGCPEL